MAEITYIDIEEAIKTLLLTDDRTKSIAGIPLNVAIEESINQNTDACPWVGIYLDRWETPAEQELIGGNTPFRTYLTFELWLYEFALENKLAAQKRDYLLQKIKEVLKDNRKLSDTVLISRFKGGEFDNAKTKEGFFKGVTIKLECELRE